VRILVLNQYFHPDQSATAQLLTQLTQDLSEHHEVWVVTGRPSYNVEIGARRRMTRERLGDVRVVRTPSATFARHSMLGRVGNYLTFLGTSPFRVLTCPKPDVILAWTDPPPNIALAAVLARVRRAPLVITCQDIVPESVIAAGELSNRVVISLLRRSTRLGFRGATRIVSIGRDMNERLRDMGVPNEKIVTITNWYDGSLVSPLDGPNRFREEHDWGDRFVVMHSGNLGMGQDLEMLIDAAEILRDDPNVLVAIVGEGMHKSAVQRAARDRRLPNVEFLPFQPVERLEESLGAADVHVVSHRRGMEGFQVPSKLYGILAAGKPVLAAVAPGCEVALTVEEADCGEVLEPGDAAELASAILRMKDGPIDELGERAREALERRYDRPIATDAYRELLEDVARRSS
jgi:putative colanic acid biosynthesis glycosyltransferase WcaI